MGGWTRGKCLSHMSVEEYLAHKRVINARYREKHREQLRERSAQYRKDNPEVYKETGRNFKRKKREQLIESLGGRCSICGCKENLELDHINPAHKTMMPSSLVGLAEDNPKRIEELKNIQLLCKKHHREKTNKQLEMAWSIAKLLPLEVQEKWIKNPPTSLEEILNSLQSHQ